MGRGSAQGEGAESQESDDSEFDSLLREAAKIEGLGPPLPQPGQVVGDKYRIEERIGRGGMGAVFRATHLVSEKPVAIKWLLRSGSDEHVRRRFLREARVAGRIDHPNVVDVYDVVQDADCCYLVMELLRGQALRARMERGPLEVAQAVDLLLPAMRGVGAMHQAGVVHRDLKPDNIFLCQAPDGTPREAKVLDFGVSAVAGGELSDPTLTADGALLGTLAYMSPEQLQSTHDVDARSDVYSFGVILYQALTGKLPFDAKSYPGLALAIVQAQPRPLTELRPELPRALEGVVMRALRRQPEERYSSMETLIAALLPFASASGTSVGEAGSGMGARDAAADRSHRRVLVWALAVTVVVALGFAAWLLTDQEAVAERSAPQRPPSPAAAEATVTKAHVLAATKASVAAPTVTQPAQPPRTDAVDLASERTTKASNPGEADRARSKRTAKMQPVPEQRSGRISVDEL